MVDWKVYPSLRATGLDAFNLLMDMLRAGQAAGFVSTGSPEQMALAGWSSVHGLALLLIAGQVRLTIGEADPEELARACARYYVQGISNGL